MSDRALRWTSTRLVGHRPFIRIPTRWKPMARPSDAAYVRAGRDGGTRRSSGSGQSFSIRNLPGHRDRIDPCGARSLGARRADADRRSLLVSSRRQCQPRGITVVSPAAAPGFVRRRAIPAAAGALGALVHAESRPRAGIRQHHRQQHPRFGEKRSRSGPLRDSGAQVDVLKEFVDGCPPGSTRRVNRTTPRAGRPGPDARDAHR